MTADTSPNAISAVIIHRKRKKRKMHHKIRNATDFLLNPPLPLPSHPPQNPKSELSKPETPSAPNTLTNDKPPTRPHLQVETSEIIPPSIKMKVAQVSPPQSPIENPFFDIPSSREVTDEQLYEEFRAAYIATGIENASQRRRRNPKKKQASTR